MRSLRDERLTPDITIRGRMPTKQEYDLHLRLLEDAKSPRRIYENWLGKDMSDLQHEVWIAVHQQGLVRQDREGYHRLTDYGKHYLSQRQRTSRDPSRRDGNYRLIIQRRKNPWNSTGNRLETHYATSLADAKKRWQAFRRTGASENAWVERKGRRGWEIVVDESWDY